MNDYIVDAFTQTEDKVNLEVDNLNVECITSKNNNFNVDSEGNITGKSINVEQSLVTQDTIRDLMYPVGSIYMSINSTSPATLFGGTWEQIKGRFLLSSGIADNNTSAVWGNYGTSNGLDFPLGEMGGEPSHLLSETEIPYHYHTFSATTNTTGSHTHTGNTLELRQTNSYNYSNDAARPITSSYSHAGVTIVNAAGDHAHTVGGNTSAIGGSGWHNNIPPYLVVNMWKRTA